MTIKNTVPYAKLLEEAVTKEGILSNCYSQFHRYSTTNRAWAWFQAMERDIPLAPIATLKQWNALGRKVKKGSSAIFLNMPVMIDVKDPITKQKTGEKKQIFIPKKNWFFLSQTEGDDFKNEVAIAEWDKDLSLKNLKISEVPFRYADGNAQGYAEDRTIAINPLAVLPHKTRFHEIAHIVLGHTTQGMMSDSEYTPRDIREVEAESVAYILCQILNLQGEKESRGYIQSWLNDKTIPDSSAKKIFAAVDKILKSGQKEITI